MHEKIKVLGIAPYEGMKSMMLKLALDRDDIDLTVYVGDLNQGVAIAQKNFISDYDVIISRGGTAEMIGQVTSIPLVEISMSVYDILRAIKLAENYSDQYAIVGFSAITSSAQLLCDLLQYKLDIFTIHNADEVQDTLTDLKNRGYRMVLCDMITNTTAKKLGLNAILITSGNESITSAFDQAVKLCHSYSNMKNTNRFLENIIRGQNSHTVVFDANHTLVFSNLEEENTEQTLEVIKKEIPETLSSGTHKFFKNIGDTFYSISSTKISDYRKDYAVFYIHSEYAPISRSNFGIKYSNRREVEDLFFNSFCSVINSSNTINDTLEHMSQSNFPIMIIGDVGSGKEQIAGVLYSKSTFNHNPLITISCSLLSDKGWGFLTNHYNSPLNDNNNTLFFKDLNTLTEARCKQFLSIIIDTNLHKRNRLIFSYVNKQGYALPTECLEYVNRLSCLTIPLQPLKENSEHIPTLSSLYLGTLNIQLSKQIIGFEPEAMALLQEYSWPYNFLQFKRVLNELALISTTPYISTTTVSSVIKKEKMSNLSAISKMGDTLDNTINLNQTLNEINHEIVQVILKQTRGNHSVAAQRLGISRTTLWRYLK